ncbi:hypothetical protein CW304_18260 [Bacillus sp. UFRGS-B20]|nr:hypothetical protein CW304_18260 [Bacillus sp. UFRGS-B20]
MILYCISTFVTDLVSLIFLLTVCLCGYASQLFRLAILLRCDTVSLSYCLVVRSTPLTWSFTFRKTCHFDHFQK